MKLAKSLQNEVALVSIKPRHAGPAIGRHPWLFAGAIQGVAGSPKDGDWVRVARAEDDVFVAYGIYNSKSQIRVRLFSWDEERFGDDFLVEQMNRAIDLRLETLGFKKSDSFRAIYSEGDELSGLVVDKFEDYLVVQVSSLGIAKRIDLIVEQLQKAFSPKAIKIKVDRLLQTHEGYDLESRWIGEEPSTAFQISDGEMNFQLDLRSGQKTGFYLDQRDNRKEVSSFSKGKRVLDLFSYSGGFALYAAKAGASEVIAVDSSAAALELAKANAKANKLTSIEFVEADCAQYLKSQEDRSFDVIVCDPPRFSSGRKETDVALRKYFSLNHEVIKKIATGGIFISCSCSGSVSMPEFIDMLASAARRAGRSLQILNKKGASMDHPVLASCPETEYLKVVVARVN